MSILSTLILTYDSSSINMWYLHAPDRTTPYEVTLKAVNDLHKEGKFKQIGISNYQAYGFWAYLLLFIPHN